MSRSNRLYGGCSTCSGADAAKPFHLDDRKIAHSDGADFPCANSVCIASAVSSIVISGSGQ